MDTRPREPSSILTTPVVWVCAQGGNLPLHCATNNQASEEVVRALIKKYPNGVKGKNFLPEACLPLQFAAKRNASSTVMLALLEADMPLRFEDGAPIEDHAFNWTTCVAATSNGAAGAIRYILSEGGFSKHIHALAAVRDEQGRPALDISPTETRKAIYEHLLFCRRYELALDAPEHRSATSIVLRGLDRDKQADYGTIFDKADTDNSDALEKLEVINVAASMGLDHRLFLKGGEESINKADFVSICKLQLGDGPRPVVIKLMQVEEQWNREVTARKKKLDPNHVVLMLKGPTNDEIDKAVESRSGGLGIITDKYLPKGVDTGRYAIVMDAADRNLYQIYLQERPDLDAVRNLLRQIFEAVAHLHDLKLMHGDLKLLNGVRFRRDNKVRLIDFDAAAPIVSSDDAQGNPSYAGAKFSSATLPPEMFFELSSEDQRKQLEEYWPRADSGDSLAKDLRNKLAPKLDRKSGKSYVVKSYRFEGGQSVTKDLPYELVEASAKLDVWALGALAFMLLTGETLVLATRDDDCASGAAMRVVYDWGLKREDVLERLEKITDDAARDLVGRMLQRDPSERPTVKNVLDTHPFFHPESNNTEVKAALNKLVISQAEDRRILEGISRGVETLDKKLDQVLHQLTAQFKMLGTLLHGIDEIAPKLICFLPDAAIGSASESWASKAKFLNPSGWFNQSVRIFFFDPIRLTLAPTNSSDKYPKGEGFVIRFPRAWVVKAMPYIKLGLTTLKVAYIAGRLAGFPVPDVAGVVGQWIDGQISNLSGLGGESKKWLADQTGDPLLATSLLDQLDDNARKAMSNEIDAIKPLEGNLDMSKLQAPLQKSFEELDALLSPTYGAGWKEKSGLVLAGPSKDGHMEWVLEEDKAAFVAQGAALLDNSPEEMAPPSPPQLATVNEPAVNEQTAARSGTQRNTAEHSWQPEHRPVDEYRSIDEHRSVDERRSVDKHRSIRVCSPIYCTLS